MVVSEEKQNIYNRPLRFIISGGGTGGHIFPAISIANAIKCRMPEAEILFVGAQNRMEMERVPAAGYKIVGLPVAGYDRRHFFKNISVAIKLLRSMSKARRIVAAFKPDIAIGVGGYASGPTLKAAIFRGIPTVLQEQNSYAGITNKMLSKKASVICVAYEGMDRFFPQEKIVLTGNPCRQDLKLPTERRADAYTYFGLDPHKRTIFLVGGSLGARSLNDSVIGALDMLRRADDVQMIWQCGKYYFKDIKQLERRNKIPNNVHLFDFVTRMDFAYAAADLIISRAGAGSISEFCILGKPVILVPSPNVAEDHQTKNAQALVSRNAAVSIPDLEASERLFKTALQLVHDDEQLDNLSKNISLLAQRDSADRIVDEIIKILQI